MKRIWIVSMLLMFLSGCAAQETFETVGVIDDIPMTSPAWEIAADIPDTLVAAAMETDNAGTLYLCDDYMMTMHTLTGGDLNGTFMECTGFEKDKLQPMETVTNGTTRYETVWSSVSETGDQIGRIAIIDDGNFHYVLTVMADAEKAGDLAETWQMLFRSFRIEEPGSIINSGS